MYVRTKTCTKHTEKYNQKINYQQNTTNMNMSEPDSPSQYCQSFYCIHFRYRCYLGSQNERQLKTSNLFDPTCKRKIFAQTQGRLSTLIRALISGQFYARLSRKPLIELKLNLQTGNCAKSAPLLLV